MKKFKLIELQGVKNARRKECRKCKVPEMHEVQGARNARCKKCTKWKVQEIHEMQRARNGRSSRCQKCKKSQKLPPPITSCFVLHLIKWSVRCQMGVIFYTYGRNYLCLPKKTFRRNYCKKYFYCKSEIENAFSISSQNYHYF